MRKRALGPHRKRRGALASVGMLLVWLSLLAISAFAARAAGFRFRWENRSREGISAPDPAEGSEAARADATTGGRKNRTARARGLGSGDTPEPGALSAEGAARRVGPRGAGAASFIDFETYADGTPACESCPVGDEFRALGVRFSFRSWTADARHPYLLDAGSYLPPGAAGPHGVASALQARGLEVGVIRLDFPDAPTRVVFDLTGPDLIDRFQVTAWTGESRIEDEAIDRGRPWTFHAAGGGVFRRERVTIESAVGIDRIELDGWGPPGHLMLIDNLGFGGSPSPRPSAR